MLAHQIHTKHKCLFLALSCIETDPEKQMAQTLLCVSNAGDTGLYVHAQCARAV